MSLRVHLPMSIFNSGGHFFEQKEKKKCRRSKSGKRMKVFFIQSFLNGNEDSASFYSHTKRGQTRHPSHIHMLNDMKGWRGRKRESSSKNFCWEPSGWVETNK